MTTRTDERGKERLPLDLQFTAAVEIGADRAVVRFGGELDLSSHGRCRRYVEEITAATDGAIVFDLSRLSFVDGAGIATLVQAARHLRTAARPVGFVIPAQGPVRRLIDLLQTIDGELWRTVADGGALLSPAARGRPTLTNRRATRGQRSHETSDFGVEALRCLEVALVAQVR